MNWLKRFIQRMRVQPTRDFIQYLRDQEVAATTAANQLSTRRKAVTEPPFDTLTFPPRNKNGKG